MTFFSGSLSPLETSSKLLSRGPQVPREGTPREAARNGSAQKNATLLIGVMPSQIGPQILGFCLSRATSPTRVLPAAGGFPPAGDAGTQAPPTVVLRPWSLRVPQTEKKNAEKSPLNRLGLQVTHVASNPICWCLVQTVVPRRAELAPLYACGLQGVRTFWRKNCLGTLLESGYRHSEYLELYARTSEVAY